MFWRIYLFNNIVFGTVITFKFVYTCGCVFFMFGVVCGIVCVDFGVIISLVQGYVENSVDHGMECCMFVLSGVI